MRICLITILLLFFCLTSCGQEKSVSFFEKTEAYELAKAVDRENLTKIESIVKENPKLLEVTNDITGANVLDLALTLEKFNAFEKLLELGANPNFINPITKRSVLIDACKFYWEPEPYTIDLRYIKLLLQKGADPNYTIEKDLTDEKGHYHMATSPLMEASKIDLEMVKVLIKAGADPYKKLEQNQETPFSSSVQSGKYNISNYFIDTLEVDIKQPMAVVIQQPSNEIVTFYIQDYVINQFLKAKLNNDISKMERLKSQNPNIERFNKEGWDFMHKLEQMGVDFKNYKYKK